MQTLLAGTAADGAAIAGLVDVLRASAQTVPGLRRVEIMIDGRTIPLSAVSNAEVEALLPELVA